MRKLRLSVLVFDLTTKFKVLTLKWCSPRKATGHRRERKIVTIGWVLEGGWEIKKNLRPTHVAIPTWMLWESGAWCLLACLQTPSHTACRWLCWPGKPALPPFNPTQTLAPFSLQGSTVGLCRKAWRGGPSRTEEEENSQGILAQELKGGQPKKTHLWSCWRPWGPGSVWGSASSLLVQHRKCSRQEYLVGKKGNQSTRLHGYHSHSVQVKAITSFSLNFSPWSK